MKTQYSQKKGQIFFNFKNKVLIFLILKNIDGIQ